MSQGKWRSEPVFLERLFLACLVVISLSLVIALTLLEKRWTGDIRSIYELRWLVGPTTSSLVNGQGLQDCTSAMGTPGNPICFHAARMPIASYLLAAEVVLFGDHVRALVLLKNTLLLVPLWLAMGVVLRRATRCRPLSVLASCAILLLCPLLILNYVATIVSPEVEEGYLYGFLALAVALLFVAFREDWRWLFSFGITLGLLFLCKSSMLPTVVILLLIALSQLRQTRYRIVLGTVVCLFPLGWALCQHTSSGRYSFGTSLDGMNFEKGNNAHFLARYPPVSKSLDVYDKELNEGKTFSGEWQFNDYHVTQAENFIRENPLYTFRSLLAKAKVLLFTFSRTGISTLSPSAELLALCGMILFRLLEWGAIALSFYSLATGKWLGRKLGAGWILTLGAYCVPYLAGFGLMRHAIMFAYPSAVVCAATVIRRYERLALESSLDLEQYASTSDK